MTKLIRPMVFRQATIREGRGFSIPELQAVGLTPTQARSLGIPVDTRRKTSHEENIEILKEFSEMAKKTEVKIPHVKQVVKGQRGRADRSLTSAGKKARGLVRGKGKN